MHTPPAPAGAGRTGSAVRIGVLAPLTRPGWTEAGRHLLAGMEPAARDADAAGGIGGGPLELVVRDTAPGALTPDAVCDALVGHGATALLLLVGHPEPAVSLVRAVRRDRRLTGLLVGAPAGQPEFAGWATALGEDGAGIPFLRYLPERLTSLGTRVATDLRARLSGAHSFVAFEGYDTIAVLADVLRAHGTDRSRIADAWGHVAVDGTRGRIGFFRLPGLGVWQWARTPIQVVDRNPARPARFRVLRTG